MNLINDISVDFTESDSPGSEQVTLEETKEYLRLQGFIPEGESPSTSLTDFDDDDSIIESMISDAVSRLQAASNVSLRNNELSGIVTNLAGRIELPFSPINEITELLDSEDDAFEADEIELIGTSRKFLKLPKEEDMQITYTTTALVNESTRISILRMVAYLYEHRGEELTDNQLRLKADELVSGYTRQTVWG